MSELSTRLSGRPRAEVATFLAESDAAALIDLLRDTADRELDRLLAEEAFREEGLAAILTRLPEFAAPDRLADLAGLVCFDLGRGRDREQRLVRFDRGAVVLVEQGPDPDVTIRVELRSFVRLVTGQCNAALLYLADELAVEGNQLLALDVGSVFRLPGSGETAVDPSSLDPVEVATAIKGVSRKHLGAVMGGDFRAIVVSEVFRRLPDFIDTGKAGSLEVTVGFRVDGRPDGGADRYVVEVAAGACTVTADPDSELPRDATLMLDGPDFLRLVTGHVNPVRALLAGQLKLKGDKTKALAFNAVMNPPLPR
jgi:putative sterol carrier protein